MKDMIHQILLLFFFISPAIIHSQNSCPISICTFSDSGPQIQYPFKLQTDHPPKDCHNFINLRCDDGGQVVISLPSLGDFYVASIDYVLEKIILKDPENCLLERLMMSNSSLYPLEAYFLRNYTYYSCPKERITPPFIEIHCLSNSVNATIATAIPLSEHMKERYGCTINGSSMIPVSWTNEYNISDDLQLTWNVPECRECNDQYGNGSPYSDGSKSKMTKLIQSPIFITSVSLLATFSGIACVLRLTATMADTDNTIANNNVEDAATSTAVAPPPPQATAGNENSQVKNFSQVQQSQGTLVSCSICLEEYNGKDMVRNLDQCGHYFHVECIDLWLQKNSSCPVCRTSLS